MGRRAKVIVLCEGAEDYHFVRRSLIELGWKKRDFQPRIHPRGAGSGEQFVRGTYPAEVAAQRGANLRKLIVATDADPGRSVEGRAQTLAKALKEAKHRARGPSEAIAHWIPKRNLETWVHLYVRGPVDEESDYKSQVTDEDYAAAAKAFGKDLKRSTIAPKRCPSLERALRETERVR